MMLLKKRGVGITAPHMSISQIKCCQFFYAGLLRLPWVRMSAGPAAIDGGGWSHRWSAGCEAKVSWPDVVPYPCAGGLIMKMLYAASIPLLLVAAGCSH